MAQHRQFLACSSQPRTGPRPWFGISAGWLCGLLLFSALPIFISGQEKAPTFHVIIHVQNESTTVERLRLSRIFLKRVRRWDDQTPILPVDLPEKSEVRENFSKAVHGKSSKAIKRYWQRQIFSGRDVPPKELATSEEVVEFVAENPGAVGYVDAELELPDSVRIVEVVD